jgi:hypothetical protein
MRCSHLSISLPDPNASRSGGPPQSIAGALVVWGPALTVAVSSLMAVLVLRLAPAPSGPVAIVFPPWWNASQVAEGAFRAGRLIRFGGLGFVAVVMRDPPGAARPSQSGAWLTLNTRVAGWCSPAPAPSTPEQ